MKKNFNTIFIQICLFSIVILPMLVLYQLLIYPVWETTRCGNWECNTMEHHIIYSRKEFNDFPLREKQNLKIYEIKDKYFNKNYYFLRTDNARLVFSTAYLSRKNAQRDLELIKNNDSIIITKKNVGFITTIGFIFYIFLMLIGILIKLLKNAVKENNKREL